ncbi:hypothetical protein [Dickeya dadantii]|nr:hypothetical protein [Dickeya dadantii]
MGRSTPQPTAARFPVVDESKAMAIVQRLAERQHLAQVIAAVGK